ncbi:unnamed protein product [Scytosiphon promiscuus]
MDSFGGIHGLAGGAGVPPGVAAAAVGSHQMMPSSHMSGDSGEDFDSLKVEMAKERNRVHARNTRARKKQYMEELKDRVESMHAKKAAVEHRKEAAAREEEEQSTRWAATLEKVLDLRCRGCADPVVWSEVLTQDFELSLPLTPYRRCDPADVEGGRRRVLIGVEGMISDTASLTVSKGTTFARPNPRLAFRPNSAPVAFQPSRRSHLLKCCIGRGDLAFTSDDGRGMMCVFSMTTVDACDFGSPLEVEKNGMLRAAFGEEGKLDELEMMFDGIAVHQQLQRAMGRVPPGESVQARPSAVVQREGTQQQQQQQQDGSSVSSSVSLGGKRKEVGGGASVNAAPVASGAGAVAPVAAATATVPGGSMDVDQDKVQDGETSTT